MVAPVLAVLLLLATTTLPPSSLPPAILGVDSLQPYAIVLLFFSLSIISVSLDATGLLAAASLKVLSLSGTSGRKLFLLIFALSSVLTILTR